jgi:hypothetical protein
MRLYCWCQSQSQSYFTTDGLVPINSSWRQAPWDPRPETFFQLSSCGNSPYVTSSWREDRFVSYEYAWIFVKCSFRTYIMLLKIPPFALRTSPLSVQVLQSKPCKLTSLMLQRQLSHLNGRKLDLLVVLSQSQSHIATDGYSVSQFCCRAPIWGSWPNIY